MALSFQAGVLSKRLNLSSRKQRHSIAQGFWFSDAKDLYEIPRGSLQGAPNTCEVGKNDDFQQVTRYI